MGLKIQTQVEHRSRHRLGLTQDQCDQQSSQSTIAIQEGMNRLELNVSQSHFDQER